MKRTLTLWTALALSLSAHTALAQQQTKPSDAPPKLEKIEEVGDDSINVTAKPTPERQITEKRDNGGRVTEVKVKSGPSTYTVRPANTTGTALPGDAVGSANHGPMWTVLEFDSKKKKKAGEDEGSTDTEAPPPPPAKK